MLGLNIFALFFHLSSCPWATLCTSAPWTSPVLTLPPSILHTRFSPLPLSFFLLHTPSLFQSQAFLLLPLLFFQQTHPIAAALLRSPFALSMPLISSFSIFGAESLTSLPMCIMVWLNSDRLTHMHWSEEKGFILQSVWRAVGWDSQAPPSKIRLFHPSKHYQKGCHDKIIPFWTLFAIKTRSVKVSFSFALDERDPRSLHLYRTINPLTAGVMATLSNGENDGIHWEIEVVHENQASGKESEVSLGSFRAKIPDIWVQSCYH